MNFLEKNEIDVVISNTLKILGLPDKNIIWDWNTKLSSCIGMAYWHNRVELSGLLFPVASIEERRNTIVHEVCHIANGHLFGIPVFKTHNNTWAELMKVCGEIPSVCHEVHGLVKHKKKEISVRCSCREHLVSMNKYGRIKNGSRVYRCRNCKDLIEL